MRFAAADVTAEHANGPALRLVETQKQAGDGRLARARGSDERDALALARREADVAQDRDARLVFEVDVLEGDGLVGGAGRTALSGGERSGHDVLLVEQLEDALGPRHRALQERVPLRQETDRLEELADVLGERDEERERDR